MAKAIKKGPKSAVKKVQAEVKAVKADKLIKYEISLVVHPEATDKEREQILENVRKAVSSWGGQVTKTDEAGKKMLAYEIAKCNEAWYYFMDADFVANRVSDLNSRIVFEDKVIRHLIVRSE